MNKTDVSQFFKGVRLKVKRHSPEILTGFGIAGMLTTTVLAVGATPKALKAIEEKKDEICENELTPVEVVKATWKYYVPAGTMFVFSTACLIGAGSVNAKRNAALAAACKLSETAFTEYREKVVETMGEKKEKTVREKIAKDHIEALDIKDEDIINTGRGSVLFLDPYTQRAFYSDWNIIEKAANEINKRMLHDINGYASLNEWYDEIGLDRVDTTVGDVIGWNAYRLMDMDKHPSRTKNDLPCFELDYVVRPRPDYNRF